jgi:pimeloyl-[acyl-carrier protein] methyl ester esterase
LRLIVLPGLDGTGALSVPLCSYLSGSHIVENIRYPENLFRYEDLAHWLEPKLGSGDYAIIAESFSGPLAIRLAAARPTGLKALVLVASFARSPRRLPPFTATLLYLLPLQSRLMIRVVQRLLVGKWGAQDFPDAFAEIIRKVPKSTLVRRLREVLRGGALDALSAIQTPRLFVAASRDALVPARKMDDFRTAGWSVEVVDGPHFLNLTRAEAVGDQIERFLAKQV